MMNSLKTIPHRRRNSSEAVLKRVQEVSGEVLMGFTVYDVLHANGSPLDAVMYAHLFWPEFVTVDDMTFLPFTVEDEQDQKRVRERRSLLSGATNVERELNHIEVAELFGRRRGETSPEEDAMLAQFLAEMWAAKLKADFPSKQFCVQILEPTADAEITVTLYEQR